MGWGRWVYRIIIWILRIIPFIPGEIIEAILEFFEGIFGDFYDSEIGR